MRELSRGAALVLGLLTVWPILYIAWFLFSFFGFSHDFALVNSAVVGALHVGTIVLIFLLLAFYLLHAYRNQAFGPEKKLRWLIALVIGHFVVMPIYWWACIWQHRKSP